MVLDSPFFPSGGGWGMSFHRWSSPAPRDVRRGRTWSGRIPINAYETPEEQELFLDDKNTFAVNTAAAGYTARESKEAKGVDQLLVTTPAGSSASSGNNVTINYDASVFLTFFESPEQADQWSGALRELAAQTGGPDARNELIGSVFMDWSVTAPESERQTVRGCVTS